MFLAPVYGLISDWIGETRFSLSICMFKFGMAKDLMAAIASRAWVGFFNGAAPVSRSYVGESANQIGLKKAKAMGLFGFCFSLGAVIGPLIWRLPEQETNMNRKPLLKFPASKQAEEQPLLPPSEDPRKKTHKPALVLIIMGQGILALHAVIFDEMYPVIVASDPSIGYEFFAKDIAHSLLVLGPFAIFTQVGFYPWLSKRISYVHAWRISSLTFFCSYAIFPLLPGPRSAPVWVEWTCLLLALAVRIAGLVIGYTSIAV
ncbi:hypothetical protein CERZMDRAFT_101736 [Cercospora zeae-maydis SCOH1-5]|uniref:Major facilitator superfamily (MFS) profile domain-containing protein n=1 Tax=Cercospora zeae-maydis SCOH1-5 TaxID=717836 RepID=A0A6A6F0N4_9PEZI|nr:hypothetical protein CERZMDRAFT_101736 [Cercospora zeae-maydis SCOH1-5]